MHSLCGHSPWILIDNDYSFVASFSLSIFRLWFFGSIFVIGFSCFIDFQCVRIQFNDSDYFCHIWDRTWFCETLRFKSIESNQFASVVISVLLTYGHKRISIRMMMIKKTIIFLQSLTLQMQEAKPKWKCSNSKLWDIFALNRKYSALYR